MYFSPFYITEAVGNNAFSYDKRENKRICVPSLVKAKSLNDIHFGNEIVFEDFDENKKLQSCKGLKNFYEFMIGEPVLGTTSSQRIPLYLFDNHNHALFFWYQAYHQGIIKESGNHILHIDEHADTRTPERYLPPLRKSLSSTGLGRIGGISQNELNKVFYYANFIANVGNYMIPAQQGGLVNEIYQIRDEMSLKKDYDAEILNLDLDFFSTRLDYIPYQKKKDFILRHISKAKVITVATSPFFINQELAISIFKDIFISFIKE